MRVKRLEAREKALLQISLQSLRDDETGDHEENIDSQESICEFFGKQMIENHQDDGDAPKAVYIGAIVGLALYGFSGAKP